MNYFYILMTAIVHNFYISVTQIDFNDEAKTLEISIKLFIDDFEKALKEESLKQTHLNTIKEIEESTELMYMYFQKYFSISVDQDTKEWRFLGREYEEDAIWCYIEVINIQDFNQIELKNELLISTHEEQKNLVRINKQGQKKSLLFQKGYTIDSAVF